jgi:hypothetical protein
MKKFLLLLIICWMSSLPWLAKAQSDKPDLIYKRDNSRIEARVKEITETDVKYQLFSHLAGPLYTLPKSKVAVIVYASGYSESMTENAPSPESSAITSTSGQAASVFTSPPVSPTGAQQEVKSSFYYGLQLANPAGSFEEFAGIGFGTHGGLLVDFKRKMGLTLDWDLSYHLPGSESDLSSIYTTTLLARGIVPLGRQAGQHLTEGWYLTGGLGYGVVGISYGDFSASTGDFSYGAGIGWKSLQLQYQALGDLNYLSLRLSLF